LTHFVERDIAGRRYKLETGKVGKQAGGSVWLQAGDTVVIANTTMSNTVKEGMDFFPLTCDYEERKYAVGKIPGGFMKRGGRPSEKSILTSRLIDRPLRPLFQRRSEERKVNPKKQIENRKRKKEWIEDRSGKKILNLIIDPLVDKAKQFLATHSNNCNDLFKGEKLNSDYDSEDSEFSELN